MWLFGCLKNLSSLKWKDLVNTTIDLIIRNSKYYVIWIT